MEQSSRPPAALGDEVALDLTGVVFVGWAGLKVLLDARLDHPLLRVTAANPRVLAVLEASGTAEYLTGRRLASSAQDEQKPNRSTDDGSGPERRRHPNDVQQPGLQMRTRDRLPLPPRRPLRLRLRPPDGGERPN